VRRKPRVRLEAQMHGGGHERGMRSGTLAHAPDRGHGRGLPHRQALKWPRNAKAKALQQRLLDGLKDIEQVFINGHLERACRTT
jgi:cysteine desulfurase